MNKYEDPNYVLPLEWHLYESVCPVLAPIAYEQIGLTPNGITTVGNIFGALGLISLYNDNYLWFFLFIMIRQMLDALDGYVARKYKHFSKWGDKYDHISDGVVTTLITILFVFKLKPRNRVFLVPMIIFHILIFEMRGQRKICLVNEDGVCNKDRHQVLTSTKFLSYTERKILKLLFVIIILKYFNK